MWILTTRGYASVVKWHDPKVGELAVRGRVKSHLEYIRSLSPETADAEIIVTPSSDYRYRFFASKEQVAEIAANAVRDITYNNFKSEVLRVQGKTRYEHALHDVWHDLATIQPGGAYGWGGKGTPPIPEGEPTRPKFVSRFGDFGLCQGKTKKGKFCSNKAGANGFCKQHADQAPPPKAKDEHEPQITFLPAVSDRDDDTWMKIDPELFGGELVCEECGKHLEPNEAEVILDEVTCRDVQACLARIEEKNAKKRPAPKAKRTKRQAKPRARSSR